MRPGVRGLQALVVALAVALGAGCRRAPEPAATLRVAVRGDVTGFFPNPPIQDEGFTFDVNWLVYEGLVRFDEDLRPRPALARRWTNPDELTYRFELRPGARFSDGRPVTAADVAASLRAVAVHGWVTLDYLRSVESVTSTEDGQVEIRTRHPYPILMAKLPWGLVLPRDRIDEVPTPVIGSGPYQLESWDPGRGFALRRNPYYSPVPGFERAEFEVVADDSERVQRLLEGEADLIDNAPLERLEELRSRGFEVTSRPTLRVIFLNMRVDTPPFSDPRLRRAVALAIDRDELIARAYGGRAEPATQLVPHSVVGFNPEVPVVKPDRERARALLDEAGFADGLDVRLDGPRNRYVYDEEMLQEVARQLGSIGVRVQVNALDKGEFYALIDSGGSPFHLLGWECKSGEAGEALEPMLHSSGGGYGEVNTVGLADPELDRLIEEAAASSTAAVRGRVLRSAMARVAELEPVLPLVVQTEAVAFSPNVVWQPGLSLILNVDEMRPATGAR